MRDNVTVAVATTRARDKAEPGGRDQATRVGRQMGSVCTSQRKREHFHANLLRNNGHCHDTYASFIRGLRYVSTIVTLVNVGRWQL